MTMKKGEKETGTRKNKDGRKTRPELNSEHEPVGRARAGRSLFQEISGSCSKLKPRKTITHYNRKQDMMRTQSKELYQRICPFATPIFESRYSEVAIKQLGSIPSQIRKGRSHCTEMK
jgi:hypothetical protein